MRTTHNAQHRLSHNTELQKHLTHAFGLIHIANQTGSDALFRCFLRRRPDRETSHDDDALTQDPNQYGILAAQRTCYAFHLTLAHSAPRHAHIICYSGLLLSKFFAGANDGAAAMEF